MTVYYARSGNQQGEKETVQHHLHRTGELCALFSAPLGCPHRGRMTGRLHDFGKLSCIFQPVLFGSGMHVNHALPGAVLAQRLCPGSEAVIASHHSQLQCFAHYRSDMNRSRRGTGDGRDRENRAISLQGPAAYRESAGIWKAMFPHIEPPEPLPDFSGAEDEALSRMLFQRMMYSALIDADWSASAEYFDPDYLFKSAGTPLDPAAALARLSDLRRKKQRHSTAAASLNTLRDGLFDRCLEMGREAPGLFTLTAPTGLGKTLSLLAFALSHARAHRKRRIILVLPYLSILEQTCGEYRKIFPDLLEVHSLAPWNEHTRELAQRWDTGCIVTTNISFFEPLFSARPGKCRHLHQIADSVILLDEAQVLPGHLLDATLRTVKDLCQRYGCTAVFSTATQPAFQRRPGLCWEPREIAFSPQMLFSATRRVRWHWDLAKPKPLKQVAAALARQEQCCAIVNLKSHARTLRRELASLCPQEAVFYLTSDLCPAHRSALLETIQERLRLGLPCRLIATQCIEAGVDLDFPAVWRALGPLDALIQAAGRCNRNGDGLQGQFTVFIPEEDRLYPSEEYRRGALCVRTLLARHPIDCSDLKHIEEYFQLLYGGETGSPQTLPDALHREDYPAVEQAYRLIPDAGVQVIVPWAPRQPLFEAIRQQLAREGPTAILLQTARELTVASLDRSNAERLCQRLHFRGSPTDIYLLEDSRFYDEHLGLRFHPSLNSI